MSAQFTARNTAIRLHGEAAEKIALDLFRSKDFNGCVTVLNELIDLIVNFKYVEVKSCQQTILNSSRQSVRKGMFTLYKHQHAELEDMQGYYLFIVLKDTVMVKIKLSRAKEITYQNQITWSKIFDSEV